MKNWAIILLTITTLLLILVTVFSAMDFPFSWVFYLTFIGQVLLVISVYRVLIDDYTTDKTFEDFYEDYPIGRQDPYS